MLFFFVPIAVCRRLFCELLYFHRSASSIVRKGTSWSEITFVDNKRYKIREKCKKKMMIKKREKKRKRKKRQWKRFNTTTDYNGSHSRRNNGKNRESVRQASKKQHPSPRPPIFWWHQTNLHFGVLFYSICFEVMWWI